MVQNACHSGDSSGPLDGSGVLQRLLPAAERRNFIAWRRKPRVTRRAALGGTLTARELLVGGSGFHVGLSFYYPLRCRASVAVFPLVLRAHRVASSERLRPCHWRLAMPGFPGEVLIPLGRLQTFPILLLARGPLWFHHLHLRAGHIHARRISESIEAVAVADSPVATHNAGKQLLGHPIAMPGVWGRFPIYRVLGKSSWGGAVGSEPPILLTRTPNGGDSSTQATWGQL